jgi:hypothetical protein
MGITVARRHRVLAASVLCAVLPSMSQAQVQVLSATYGSNCNAPANNATAALAAACNGSNRCDYVIDYKVLGDPAPGCAKTFVAEWSCAAGATPHLVTVPAEAGFGSHVVLSCGHVPPIAAQVPAPPAVPPQVAQVPPKPVPPAQVAELIATLELTPAWQGPFAGNKPIIFHWTLTNTTPIALIGKFAVTIDGASAAIAGLPEINGLLPSAQQTGDLTLPGLPGGEHEVELRLFPAAGNAKAEVVGKGKPTRTPLARASLEISVSPPFIDADNDTLDDNFEHALLEHYRPYYEFSKPGVAERALLQPEWDPYPPIDAAEYLRHSQVGWEHAAWTKYDVLLQPDVFQSGQFEALLSMNVTSDDTCTENLHDCGSDMTVNKRKTQYAISAVELPDAHAAMDTMQSVGNIGLYGHVVPYDQSSSQGAVHRYFPTDLKQRFIKIEYWQFFPRNGGNFPHGGDWATVQLLIDMDNALPCQKPTAFGQIASVFHYHHGAESRFDFAQCTFGERAAEEGVFQFVSTDHQKVQMFKDASGDFSHPVVYIEYGTHEFWPTSEGFVAATPNHDGNGASFLTATPPNLGEVEAPLEEYAQARVLMRFNGFWGACCVANKPPPGPALHNEWTWPASSSVGWTLQGKEY